jgi:hypothetical protein
MGVLEVKKMVCSGITDYLLKNSALSAKRAEQHCKPMREMFKKIRRRKGRHLISIVQPHFHSCVGCQLWAERKGYNVNRIIREAC